MEEFIYPTSNNLPFLFISHTSALIVLMSLIKIYLRVRDYGEYANQLVYSEDSTNFDNEIVKTAEGGMDVFIRKK